MNRRSLIALPGIAAFAASQAFGQTQETTASGGLVPHVSHKTLVKHTGAKAAYKIPKSAGKQVRYLNSLTALLSLTTAQQLQAASGSGRTLRCPRSSGGRGTIRIFRNRP